MRRSTVARSHDRRQPTFHLVLELVTSGFRSCPSQTDIELAIVSLFVAQQTRLRHVYVNFTVRGPSGRFYTGES